jgi:hypothetical protein
MHAPGPTPSPIVVRGAKVLTPKAIANWTRHTEQAVLNWETRGAFLVRVSLDVSNGIGAGRVAYDALSAVVGLFENGKIDAENMTEFFQQWPRRRD